MGEFSASVMDIDSPNCIQKYYSGCMVREHHTFLVDGLQKFLMKESLCDFTFTRQKGNLRAHKLVMAASSPFFYSMLITMCKNQKRRSHFTANDIDPQILRLILDFSYPGILKVEVNERRLDILCQSLESLSMANMLNHRCEISMMDLDFNSLVRRWRVASSHRLEDATKQIVTFLLSNFEYFLRSPYFAQIPFELLAAVISCDDEHLVNEHLLLCALHQWVFHCPTLRVCYIESLLTCMRATMNIRGNLLAAINELLTINHGCEPRSPVHYQTSPKLRSPKTSCHVTSENSGSIFSMSDEKRERVSIISPEAKCRSKKGESTKSMTPAIQPSWHNHKIPMCDRLCEVVEKLWDGPRKGQLPTLLQTSTSDTVTSKHSPGIQCESSFFEHFPTKLNPKKKSPTLEPRKSQDTHFMKLLRISPECKQHGGCVSPVFNEWNPSASNATGSKNNSPTADEIDLFINSPRAENKKKSKAVQDDFSCKQKLDELIQTMRVKLDTQTSPPQNSKRNETAISEESLLYRNGSNLDHAEVAKPLSTLCNQIKERSNQLSSFQAFKLQRHCTNQTDIENQGKSLEVIEKISPFAKTEITPINSPSTSPSSAGSISPQLIPDRLHSQQSFWTNDADSYVMKKTWFSSFNSPENVASSPRSEAKQLSVIESVDCADSSTGQLHLFCRDPTKQLLSSTDSHPTAFGLSLPTVSQTRITPEEIEKRLEKFKQVMNVDNSDLKGINLKGSRSFVIPFIGDNDERIMSESEQDFSSASDDELYCSLSRIDWSSPISGFYRALSTIPEECQEDLLSSSSVRTEVSSCPQTSPTSIDVNQCRRKPWDVRSESPQKIELQERPTNSSRIGSPVRPANTSYVTTADSYPSWVTKMCEANNQSRQCPVPAWLPVNSPLKELHSRDEDLEPMKLTDASEIYSPFGTNLLKRNLALLDNLKTMANNMTNVCNKEPVFWLNLQDAKCTSSPVSSPVYRDILQSPIRSPVQQKTVSPTDQQNRLSQWKEKPNESRSPTNSHTQTNQSPRSSVNSWSSPRQKSQRSAEMTSESIKVLTLPDTPSSSMFSFCSDPVSVYPSGTQSDINMQGAMTTDEVCDENISPRSGGTEEFDGPPVPPPGKSTASQEYLAHVQFEKRAKQNVNPDNKEWVSSFTKQEFCKNESIGVHCTQQRAIDYCKKITCTDHASPKCLSKQPIPYYKKKISNEKIPTFGESVTVLRKDGDDITSEEGSCKKSDTSVYISLKALEVTSQSPTKSPPLKISTKINKELHKANIKVGNNYAPAFLKNSSVPTFFNSTSNVQSKNTIVASKQMSYEPRDLASPTAPISVHSDTRDYRRSGANNLEFGIYSSRTTSYYSEQPDGPRSSQQNSSLARSLVNMCSGEKHARHTTFGTARDWKNVDDDAQGIPVRRVEAVFLPIEMFAASQKSSLSSNHSVAKNFNSRFTETLLESETSTIRDIVDSTKNCQKELNFLPSDIGPVLVFLSGSDQGDIHRYCYSLRRKAWLPPLTLIVPEGANNCSIAYYNNKIYFIGGDADSVYRRHNSMRAYNCLKNCLEMLANMGLARVDSGVTVFEEHIYVMGGLGKYHKPLAQVERYSIGNDSWKLIAAMRHARSSLSTATVSGLIYAIGGIVNSNKSLSMVTRVCERYDPVIDQWSEIENLPSHFDTFVPLVVAIGERLYAVRIKGPDKVYTFNMGRCKWMAIKDSRLAACSISVLLPGEWRMYAVSASSKIIFVFDLHAYQWQVENHFPEEVKWMQLAYSMNLFD